MASEAITRNDLKAILNEVLPPTASEYKKLLWMNPSPTSSFAAQTINLDLSGYNEIEIEVRYRNGTSNNGVISNSSHFEVPASGSVSGMIQQVATNVLANRTFTVTSTSITCTAATWYSSYNSSTTVTTTDLVIPYRIYGIKYERVAPPQVELPTYSTTEQVIGTWIDGKPIYRKVLTGTSAAGITNVNVSTLSIDFMVNAHITIHNSGNSSWVFDSYVQTSGSDSFNLYMSADRSVIYLRSGSSYAFGQYWLILEYTKTTD